jgi:hypothetical protein
VLNEIPDNSLATEMELKDSSMLSAWLSRVTLMQILKETRNPFEIECLEGRHISTKTLNKSLEQNSAVIECLN